MKRTLLSLLGLLALATSSAGAEIIDDFSSEYRIAQNDAFDWFRVSPRGGTLESGQEVTFTVTLVPEKMPDRSIYRGDFLI